MSTWRCSFFLLTSVYLFAIIGNIKAHSAGEDLAMPRQLTTEEFIERAKAVHGNKYDYSKTEYKGTKKLVCIICPEHGEFWQSPNKHVSTKQGCSKCKGVAKKTTEEFILEAKAVHGDKYDYSKAVYKAARKKVAIICPIHGVFWKTPNKHVSQKQGCSKCARARTAQILRMSHEEWVAAIAEVNPNIEILGKIISGSKPVPCLCKICHHEWLGVPAQLKSGHGCVKCCQSGFLSHEQGSLYILVDDVEVPTIMKVGVSIDAEKRKDNVLRSAKKAGAVFSDLHVIKTWEGTTDDMQALEKAMHQALSQYKINFTEKFDGCQEFFYYRPEVFELIEEHLKKFSTEE